MAASDGNLDIYKPFRCEGGQASQSPELDLEGGSDAAFSGSHQELVPCSRVEGEESNVEGAVPTSRTAVVVRKERVKKDGSILEVPQLGKTSDSDSETDSLAASTSPKNRLPRNFSNSTCTTTSPKSQHIFSEYSYSDSSDGEGTGNYLLPIQAKQNVTVHKNSTGGKMQGNSRGSYQQIIGIVTLEAEIL